MITAKFFTASSQAKFPLFADDLILKIVGEERFAAERLQERLPVFRAMYQDPKLSSRHFAILTPKHNSHPDVMMEDMKFFHFKPATYADLLYVASTFAEEIKGPVMAFGTKTYKSKDKYEVPIVDGGVGVGGLSLSLTGVGEHGFGGGWAYLAYPEGAESLTAVDNRVQLK